MESAIEYFIDFFTQVRRYFSVSAGMKEGDKEKLQKEVFAPAAERAFKYLGEIISKSESGFLVDSGISWGDFYLAEYILTFQNFDSDFVKHYPKMVEHQKRVHGHDKIKEYISNRKALMF